jgi:hypothetical protein
MKGGELVVQQQTVVKSKIAEVYPDFNQGRNDGKGPLAMTAA